MKNKEIIKSYVDGYIRENQLYPAKDLLKKDLPASLMPLFDDFFGGIDMEEISTVYYLKEYRKFLKDLRKIYKVKEVDTSKKLLKR